jgi:SAM-dependent methyltransferase
MRAPDPIRPDPARERAELEAYLGPAFELGRLQRYEDQLDREFEDAADEGSFYRSSEGYLYNLTAFAITETKLPYLDELRHLVEPGARILDYGCGIGSDGLLLLEAGYAVEFADFDNPSVEYLRWRLRRRGLEAPIHDLDQAVPGGFDLAYAFDVIEHVDDPFAFLAELEARASIVLVNLLEPESAEDPEFHRELPIDAIGRRACAAGLRSYSIHHGRSHLLAYAPGTAGPLARQGGRMRLAAARLRRRLAG